MFARRRWLQVTLRFWFRSNTESQIVFTSVDKNRCVFSLFFPKCFSMLLFLFGFTIHILLHFDLFIFCFWLPGCGLLRLKHGCALDRPPFFAWTCLRKKWRNVFAWASYSLRFGLFGHSVEFANKILSSQMRIALQHLHRLMPADCGYLLVG